MQQIARWFRAGVGRWRTRGGRARLRSIVGGPGCRFGARTGVRAGGPADTRLLVDGLDSR